jgi:hypothetical protein
MSPSVGSCLCSVSGSVACPTSQSDFDHSLTSHVLTSFIDRAKFLIQHSDTHSRTPDRPTEPHSGRMLCSARISCAPCRWRREGNVVTGRLDQECHGIPESPGRLSKRNDGCSRSTGRPGESEPGQNFGATSHHGVDYSIDTAAIAEAA